MSASTMRIIRELAQIQKEGDLSIAVAHHQDDIRRVRALIVGPQGTPYEYGFFEFDVKFSAEYPGKPPEIRAVTTNLGKTRFNPNIYASGKVCLSILGTWRGERGEEWSSAQGLESILLSIQSLLSANPYENEPGFEDCSGDEDSSLKQDYVRKIRHETLRISVISRMEDIYDIVPPMGDNRPTRGRFSDEDKDDSKQYQQPFDPFRDLYKRRFLWYYESYLRCVEDESKKVQADESFVQMPFESPHNTMDGSFNYPGLSKRLQTIKGAIEDEIASCSLLADKPVVRDSAVYANLKRQHEQVVEGLKSKSDYTLVVELAREDNPFVWNLTYFGKPMSNLDGGMLKLRIVLSDKFPQEQPFVFVDTPLFHVRVSKHTKILCYLPRKCEDMASHLEGIIHALQEEQPAYDPRTIVNIEAASLMWGSSDDRKKYNQNLRRTVQRSMEE